MKLINNKYIIVAVISFLAGLLVYDLFIVDLYLASKIPDSIEPQTLEIECPGEEFVYQAGMTWSDSFHEKYPDATIEEKVASWNNILGRLNCAEYQVSVADVHYSGMLSDLMFSTSTEQVECPTHDEVSGVFEQWFTYFTKANPEGSDATLMQQWDELMVRNGCMELVDPFKGDLPTL